MESQVVLRQIEFVRSSYGWSEPRKVESVLSS